MPRRFFLFVRVICKETQLEACIPTTNVLGTQLLQCVHNAHCFAECIISGTRMAHAAMLLEEVLLWKMPFIGGDCNE